MEMTRLCLYDIGISHPRGWSLQSNPNKVLAYDQGMLKLDKVESAAAVSLSLKWFPLEGFDGAKYVHALQDGLKKRFKSKLFDYQHREVELCGHEARLAVFNYSDNHGIYKVWRKDEEVTEMQVVLPCATTGRVVIANLASAADNMRKQAMYFEAMLMRLECHPERTPVRSADGMGIRAA